MRLYNVLNKLLTSKYNQFISTNIFCTFSAKLKSWAVRIYRNKALNVKYRKSSSFQKFKWFYFRGTISSHCERSPIYYVCFRFYCTFYTIFFNKCLLIIKIKPPAILQAQINHLNCNYYLNPLKWKYEFTLKVHSVYDISYRFTFNDISKSQFLLNGFALFFLLCFI